MKWLTQVCKWLSRLFGKKKKLHYVKVEELPDDFDADKIYLLGEAKYMWSVAMKCPCGCGETLQMNLLPETRPRWDVSTHWNRTVTLHPSVWRKVGCRSHFFLKKGRIVWC